MEQATKCFMLNVLSFHGAGYKIHIERPLTVWMVQVTNCSTTRGMFSVCVAEATHCFTLGILRVNDGGDELLHTWIS